MISAPSEQVDLKPKRSNGKIAMNDKSAMQLNDKSTVAADPDMKKLSQSFPSSMVLALKKIANLQTSKSSMRHIKNSKGGGGGRTMVKMVAEPEPGIVKPKPPVAPSEEPAIKNNNHEKVLPPVHEPDRDGQSSQRLTDTSMADANGAPRVIKIEKAGPAGSSVERAKAKAEVEEPTIEEHGRDAAQPFEPEEHDQEG